MNPVDRHSVATHLCIKKTLIMKTKISNSLNGLWNRLPLIVRAVLTGFLVSSVGVSLWSVMLAALPGAWPILPMIVILWLYWKFFSGGFSSGKRANLRRATFRSTKLQPGTWKWGLAAAALFVIVVQASFVVTFRLVDFPAAKFTADYKQLDAFPLWQAFAIIVMSSVAAAIAEEAGFRGYMQAPLEKKYGVTIAIVITSCVFTGIHLSHSWAPPIWPHIFFASVLLGILAYRTGSIIPGIIGHAILDIFDYSVWWTDLTGGFQKQTIFRTGVDLHFGIWVLIFMVALFGFFKVMIKLKGDKYAQSFRVAAAA
jgi:membrane protease YdiL (CAAX protease family)